MSSNTTLILIVIIVSATIYFTNRASYQQQCSCGRCPDSRRCPDCGRIYFGIPGKIPPAHPVRWHIGR